MFLLILQMKTLSFSAGEWPAHMASKRWSRIWNPSPLCRGPLSCFLSFSECCCCCSVTQSCPILWPHELQHTRLLCPSLSPRVCSNSCPLSQVVSVHPSDFYICFIFRFFFHMYLKSALVSKSSKMLRLKLNQGGKLSFHILSAKQEAATHWNSSSCVLKCLQRIQRAGHEYVDTQEMSKADVAPISAGPF